MQKPLLFLLLEELIAAHGIIFIGQSRLNRRFLPGLATAPAGSQSHSQRLILHFALFLHPDAVEHIHAGLLLPGHQTTGHIQLQPLGIVGKHRKEFLLILIFCSKLRQHPSARYTYQLVQHPQVHHLGIFMRNFLTLQRFGHRCLNSRIITVCQPLGDSIG